MGRDRQEEQVSDQGEGRATEGRDNDYTFGLKVKEQLKFQN